MTRKISLLGFINYLENQIISLILRLESITSTKINRKEKKNSEKLKRKKP